jgi:hypothetical protein
MAEMTVELANELEKQLPAAARRVGLRAAHLRLVAEEIVRNKIAKDNDRPLTIQQEAKNLIALAVEMLPGVYKERPDLYAELTGK